MFKCVLKYTTPPSLRIEQCQHQIYLNRTGKCRIQSRNFIVELDALRTPLPSRMLFLANSKIAKAGPENFCKQNHMLTPQLQLRKIHSNLDRVEYCIKYIQVDLNISIQEQKFIQIAKKKKTPWP